MKRNFKKTAVMGLIIGCLTIGSVGVLAYANGNAYQNFKNAAMQTAGEQNMTVIADVSVRQDGNPLLSGNSVMQTDGKNQYAKSQVNVNGEILDMESSAVNGTSIIRIGNEYTSVKGKEYDRDDKEHFNSTSSNSVKLGEMIIDLLVGDVKTHFNSSDDMITVNLEGAQIPELLNVAASAMIEQTANKPNKVSSENEIFGDIFNNLAITQDIQIKRIGLESQLAENYLSDNIVTIILTGKDDNGASHEIEIICNISISNIGSTTPDMIDTTGKTVTEKNIEAGFRRH